MSLLLISSERFAEHVTPQGHPESPDRAGVMNEIAAAWRASGGRVLEPSPVSREQLERVHDADYLDRLDASSGRAVAFDPDTYTSPRSVEIARLAAGAAVDAVERVLTGSASRALALIRPPGHHAERERAMGFCLYNNVAVAAAHARTWGLERVAIVDYDVHHGNGTEQIFAGDPSVLYVSTHQYPFYPGTGAANDIGIGAGEGFTVNLPIEAGAGDDDYRLVFSEGVVPLVEEFRPEILLVSAGFDAHGQDPLAGMRLTSAAFGAMTAHLLQVAEETCGGRIVLVTEGGYDLPALAESLQAVVDVLGIEGPPRVEWPEESESVRPTRGREALRKLRAARATRL